jgi:hypothetical protein
MAWTITPVDQIWVGNPGFGHPRLITISDCVYGGTGYGGGLSATGATGATGPTKSDLGFTGTTDASFTILSIQQVGKGTGATGAVYPGLAARAAVYDYTNQKLIVGATAATDISDVTYRVAAIGVYGP